MHLLALKVHRQYDMYLPMSQTQTSFKLLLRSKVAMDFPKEMMETPSEFRHQSGKRNLLGIRPMRPLSSKKKDSNTMNILQALYGLIRLHLPCQQLYRSRLILLEVTALIVLV
jgi:hypothetical protein